MKLDACIRENEVRLKDSHHTEWKEQVAEQYVYYDLMSWLKNKNAISSIYSSIWFWNDSHHHVASHRSDLRTCSCPCLGAKEEEQAIGTITDVLSTGANDVYVINMTDGKELLLPAIKDCILQVDMENRKMKVHVLEGLLD